MKSTYTNILNPKYGFVKYMVKFKLLNKGANKNYSNKRKKNQQYQYIYNL